jgi:hypothetical protein
MPAKRSKVAKAARTPQPKLQLGDRVTIPNSPLVWTILTISSDGLATLTFEDTNLQRFRVQVSDMKPAK